MEEGLYSKANGERKIGPMTTRDLAVQMRGLANLLDSQPEIGLAELRRFRMSDGSSEAQFPHDPPNWAHQFAGFIVDLVARAVDAWGELLGGGDDDDNGGDTDGDTD